MNNDSVQVQVAFESIQLVIHIIKCAKIPIIQRSIADHSRLCCIAALPHNCKHLEFVRFHPRSLHVKAGSHVSTIDTSYHSSTWSLSPPPETIEQCFHSKEECNGSILSSKKSSGKQINHIALRRTNISQLRKENHLQKVP